MSLGSDKKIVLFSTHHRLEFVLQYGHVSGSFSLTGQQVMRVRCMSIFQSCIVPLQCLWRRMLPSSEESRRVVNAVIY